MFKKIILVVNLLLSFGCLFSFAKAQVQPLAQEFIVSYNARIEVNTDNSINVTETIVYNTGSQERHGIYRDIYPYSSQKYKLGINNISVTDENSASYLFQTSTVNSRLRIMIGDPDRTFIGQKVYVIKYHASNAIAQLKDVDEIYWNVTGNDWAMPIHQASATIILPANTKLIQSACYYGIIDSTNKCPNAVASDNDTYVFSAPSALNPHEGLTVAIGFPKGTTPPYTISNNAPAILISYLPWILMFVLPILTFLFSFLYWRKNGRDELGTNVIVPQYDVPDNLTPMEVSAIVNESLKVNDISAEIIYLATKGYLLIEQSEEKFIGIFKVNDYTLTRLKEFSDQTNNFDKKLIGGLFAKKFEFDMFNPDNYTAAKLKGFSELANQTNKFNEKFTDTYIPDNNDLEQLPKQTTLSKLKNTFYKEVLPIIDFVLEGLLERGYYKNLGNMKSIGRVLVARIFISIWAFGFILFIIVFIISASGISVYLYDTYPTAIGLFISIIIFNIFYKLSPAKTKKGTLTKEYLLGLKDYLQIAEKDRLQFHNAPEKNPETFEKLLPYAMALGVLDIWAKEFEGILVAPPSWYSGPVSTGFNAVTFGHSLNSFSSFTSSTMSSSPSSGGSSGGGSSGGGGGGGGGGSW